jgi:hypothetical protein
LGLSAWANAREYFDKKKVAAEKVPPDLSPSISLAFFFAGPDRGRNREPHNHPPKPSKTPQRKSPQTSPATSNKKNPS